MMAETIARALDGRRAGQGWLVRCPAHEDRSPSLSIREIDGRLLLHCFAGCAYRDVRAALDTMGLVERGAPRRLWFRPRPVKPDLRTDGNRAAALGLWAAGIPADGTLAEAYLRARGLTLGVPEMIRFHPRLRHPDGGYWPAMMALVTDGRTGEARAIHRTFLARDGAGKATVSGTKMMLGPCRGGCVRLGEAAEAVIIGEGIETCLSVMQASGIPAWAALSTVGLRVLELPAHVREVMVAADGDVAGEAAAQTAALRWHREGRRVRIARPPEATDFNDVLRDMGDGSAAR